MERFHTRFETVPLSWCCSSCGRGRAVSLLPPDWLPCPVRWTGTGGPAASGPARCGTGSGSPGESGPEADTETGQRAEVRRKTHSPDSVIIINGQNEEQVAACLSSDVRAVCLFLILTKLLRPFTF